jgi:hypothetical protein
MADFQGKNGQNIKKQFFERLKYSVQAFNNVGGPESTVKNFNFAERSMYGRITKSHEIVTVNPVNLTAISSRANQKNEIRSVNFVSDAFEALVLEFNKASFSGKLDQEDAFLSKLEAHVAFVDPVKNYKNYNNKLSDIIVNNFLTTPKQEEINDFSSFINLFSSFILEISNSLPITFNSFMTSVFANIMNTGLAISVSDLDCSDDSTKEKFINSPNFAFFKLAAEKHGFSISKDAPWILVADIAGPAMLRYSSRYGLNTEDQILGAYFIKTHQRDIQNLQKLSYNTYNRLIARSPKNTIISGFATASSTCRAPISVQQFDDQYPDKNWVDMYSDIRYIEQSKPGSLANLNEIKRRAKAIQSIKGTIGMQIYINLSIRGFDNYNGSFAKVVEKLNFAETNKITKPTY